MKKDSFVHLHLHTQYSLLDGACKTGDVIDAAVRDGQPAIAMTDHGVLYGAVDFYNKAMKKGIKPIIGCEVYVARGSRHDRKLHSSAKGKSNYNHLVLLAENEVGYKNLMKLVSFGHLEGFYYKPRIDLELLSQYSEGLIGSSACLAGSLAQSLLYEDVQAALKVAGEHADILGKENYYLEIQDHSLSEQRQVNKGMLEVMKKTGFPIIATNDVHYLEKGHAVAHEVMLCLQTGTFMSDPKRMKYGPHEFYFKTAQEMRHLFRDIPESITNTLDIAERCCLEMEFGQLHFPTFDVPEGYNQKKYLIKICKDGIRKNYGIEDIDKPKNPDEKEVADRFYYEMGIIEQTGFINYFLVVWDFVRFAKENNIPVGPGRGSGAGSLMAYALGITALDPLRYGLIFERFLNPERVSAPDFDIDFCQSRRGEVIEYVKQKYGRENCAQIITFGSLGAKMVIRDVGRVLEIPYAECDRLSKMVPEDPKMNLKKALEDNPEFKREYEQNENCKRILDFAFPLEGLCRQPGTHAAGVVIGEKPLVELIPLARDKDGELITQYTMEPLGEIGLLKMDFLGLKTLTVIQECVDLVKEIHDVTIDLEKLDLEDQTTYDLLRKGDTVGVFQLESSGMRDLIRRVDVTRVEHLIAMIALYRPGPMNMLDDYVDRKLGRAKIKYDHPLLEPILEETYGVMIYQEQVQKAANVLAGYSLGQGDILRRAMGKKKKEEMDTQRKIFIEGCGKNNIDKTLAGKIFDTIAQFAGYGFNKSHSAAYGIIAYQTAYLKAHYPAEFMSALLSSEIGNSDKLLIFIKEAREMGLLILPPDINESDVRFRPIGDAALRFGLAGIKNVGAGAADAIVRNRKLSGEYSGMMDLAMRLDGSVVNKKILENLVKAGAFDSFDLHRARYFNGVEFVVNRAAASHRDRDMGQGSLFDLGDASGFEAGQDSDIPDCPEWAESEFLAGEKELLGLYVSGHPLAKYESLLKRYQLSTVKDLPNMEDKESTRLGGIITGITVKLTKSQENMAWVQFEDLEGSMELLVFPEAYRKCAMHLQPDATIMVSGQVSRRDEPPKLIVSDACPLTEAPRHYTKRVSIHVPTPRVKEGVLEEVKDLLRGSPGNVPVFICLVYPEGHKVFLSTDQDCSCMPSDDLIKELNRLLGEKSVYISVNKEVKAPPRKQWNKRPAGASAS